MAVWALTETGKIVRLPDYLLQSKHFHLDHYKYTTSATPDGLKQLAEIRCHGYAIFNATRDGKHGVVRTSRASANLAGHAGH